MHGHPGKLIDKLIPKMIDDRIHCAILVPIRGLLDAKVDDEPAFHRLRTGIPV